MSPILRAARRADLPAIYVLLREAFPEAPHLFVPQTERDSTFRLRHARVAEVDGRIAAYVRIFARRMLVHGHAVPAGGIGSVATAAHARRHGLATMLLEDAIGEMERDGMALSFLFTGIPGFYERLGYHIVHQPYFEASRAELAAIAGSPAAFDVRPATESDVAAMLSVYRRATAGTTGAIVRTPRTWCDATNWLAERQPLLASDRLGSAVAYLRSRCRGETHQIIEAMCADRADPAIVELLRAVASAECACGETISAIAPAGSTLATVMRSLASVRESKDWRYPMMMRAIEPHVADAITSDAIHFWHADRI